MLLRAAHRANLWVAPLPGARTKGASARLPSGLRTKGFRPVLSGSRASRKVWSKVAVVEACVLG